MSLRDIGLASMSVSMLVLGGLGLRWDASLSHMSRYLELSYLKQCLPVSFEGPSHPYLPM
jgi:hypothetical protein